MTAEERKVIVASSAGTVFEWYDFYLAGSLAANISQNFVPGTNDTAKFIFVLFGFAAGFAVRPFGALFFGRLGDLIGRKYTFLVTMTIMGLATFIVGLLPGYQSIGYAAPVAFIACRLLQGLALGGEYGGAATYVAEHSPQGRRGFYTSWIQTTATVGLFLSLIVILVLRLNMSTEAFASYGWRIPFLLSIILLAFSIWIRLQLAESPAFQKMKEEGTRSKAPLTEAFGRWDNAKIAILALLGGTAGQAVVWYTGQFYALFFLTQTLKVDGTTANLLIAFSLLIGTPFFVVFGWLSDKIGRKPILLAGCLIAAITYFPAVRADRQDGKSEADHGDGDGKGRAHRRSRHLRHAVRSRRRAHLHLAMRRGAAHAGEQFDPLRARQRARRIADDRQGQRHRCRDERQQRQRDRRRGAGRRLPEGRRSDDPQDADVSAPS